MSDPKHFINFVTTITKIVNITNEAHEAYELLYGTGNRVRPVNTTRDGEGLFRVRKQQLKAKDEEHFFKATMMSMANFNLLLSLLKERLEHFSNRKAIDPETRLSITIFYLGQGCSIQVCALAFKLSISTVRKIIYETCDAIWDELHCTYVSPPNVTELKSISDKFYIETGLPNCIGAIGGKHIHITRPRKGGTLSYNYKKSFSTVLLAACDANYVFTYVDVGPLGNQSNGGVFARSEFGNKILNGTLEVPNYTKLPGTSNSFPYYFVADSGFPLKSNLMRPFPGNHLPADKDRFNTILSKTRGYIENSFGILANRWRILHTNINASPQNADKIVLATVVLHNFLMLKDDRTYFTLDLVDHTENDENVRGEWRNETTPLESFQPKFANRSSSNAFDLRETLKKFFQNTSG